MLKEIRPAIMMIVVMTVITGLAYPLGMTAMTQLVFPHQANGSLIKDGKKVIGSELIGQNFTSDRYFHGRPSATTEPDPKDPSKTVPMSYAADNSAGSNAGPTSKALIGRIRQDAQKLQAENPTMPVPVDLVTTSGSGIDPDITPQDAQAEIPMVARATGVSPAQLQSLINRESQGRELGFLGSPIVNVLQLNEGLAKLEHP